MTGEYKYTAVTSGARLDAFVAASCTELSRTHARKLIDQGFIRVNGKIYRASHKLKERVDNNANVLSEKLRKRA